MKNLLLFSFIMSSLGAFSQCNQLFFSEYVEGWSNNKALEIFNPTASAIDLSNYQIERYSNGGASSGVDKTISLSGTIPAKGTYVIVIDKRDPNGTGQEAPVWDSLQAKADVFMCPNYNTNNTMYFNGNDAVILATKSPYALVDMIGKIGEDPDACGSNPVGGWNNVGTSYVSCDNASPSWTTDHTMVRRYGIGAGQSNPSIPTFNPSLYWDTLPANTFSGLGSHTCNCNPPLSIEGTTSAIFELEVMPNPASNQIKILAHTALTHFVVVDLAGRVVFSEQALQGSKVLDVNSLEKGMYFVKAFDKSGKQSMANFLKQ